MVHSMSWTEVWGWLRGQTVVRRVRGGLCRRRGKWWRWMRALVVVDHTDGSAGLMRSVGMRFLVAFLLVAVYFHWALGDPLHIDSLELDEGDSRFWQFWRWRRGASTAADVHAFHADAVPLSVTLRRLREDAQLFRRELLEPFFELNATRIRQREAHIFEQLPPQYLWAAFPNAPCWFSHETGVHAPAGQVHEFGKPPYHPLLGGQRPSNASAAAQGDYPALLCLPSFFLLGPSKTGSTDLFFRIQRHPEAAQVRQKEPMWWAKERWLPGRLRGRIEYRERHRDVRKCRYCFTTYARQLGTYVNENVRAHLGDGSPSTFHAMRGFGVPRSLALYPFRLRQRHNRTLAVARRRLPDKPLLVPQLLREALPPSTRFIVSLREPISRFVSDYNYFRYLFRGATRLSSAALDAECLEAARALRDCIRGRSANDGGNPWVCAWHPEFGYDPCRLSIGFYSLYLRAWYALWPPEQVLVVFIEDYDRDPQAFMERVFRFLGMQVADDDDGRQMPWRYILAGRHQNALGGRMRSQARPSAELLEVLRDIYAPWNDDLQQVLGVETLPWTESTTADRE
ncbi:hypothetical protein CDCA_CDCA20G4759 [Cyanidium caldarium]|uniref:Sulfotransferase domain-containing protein n=1 Tax=Cyanidium caldarium TaxID=2771 RepID=A0AAV9J2F2_CYACA|nr:hypothetical protein CDCA_CDCA20G4759 [Cyanidium caldarium]